MIDALECYIAVSADAPGEMADRTVLYRELVASIKRLSSGLPIEGQESHELGFLPV